MILISRVCIELNSENVKHNVDTIKKYSCKDIIAVVKDNAYSHGSREMVYILKDNGINYFAVATLREAVEISDLVSNILLFETLCYEELENAYNFNFILSLTSEEYIDTLIKSNLPLRCHLKVDCGMNRYGVEPKDVNRIMNKIKESSLILEGVYTHFGKEDKDGMQREYEVFKRVVDNIDRRGLMIHCSKSNAIFEIEDSISTHCRPGLCLYGISNNPKHRMLLKPILNVYSYPTRVKKVIKDETLGYNDGYIVDEDGYAVTIDYGYGDGMLTKDTILYMLNGRVYESKRSVVCMDSMILYMKEKIDKNTKLYFVNEILNLNYYRDLYGDRACELSTRLNRRIKRDIL